jgi:hypothetical protein
MFSFKKYQKKNSPKKDHTSPCTEQNMLQSVMSVGKIKQKLDDATRSIQHVDLTNSMQLKAGILKFDKAIERPTIINKKDNPNDERFNYTSAIPEISTKAT